MEFKEDFLDSWQKVENMVYKTAVSKGWWEERRSEAELIALMHSELSEALEYVRIGNPADDKIPQFIGLEAELADVVIRIMDMAYAHGLETCLRTARMI